MNDVINAYEYISFKYYIFKLIVKDFFNNVNNIKNGLIKNKPNSIFLQDDDYNEVVDYAGDNPHITKEK